RPRVELARGLRRLPAPQDGGRRRAAPHPHRARRRVRPARVVNAPRLPISWARWPMSFRLRVTLLATAAVAIAVVAASAVVYVVVRHQLLGEVDSSLSSRAQ